MLVALESQSHACSIRINQLHACSIRINQLHAKKLGNFTSFKLTSMKQTRCVCDNMTTTMMMMMMMMMICQQTHVIMF